MIYRKQIAFLLWAVSHRNAECVRIVDGRRKEELDEFRKFDHLITGEKAKPSQLQKQFCLIRALLPETWESEKTHFGSLGLFSPVPGPRRCQECTA